MSNITLGNEQKTIILLGAGASRPAGVPIISEMTEDFLNDPTMLRYTFAGRNLTDKEQDKIKQYLQILSDITQTHHGKNDLEYMMTFLGQLEDPTYREFLKSKYHALESILSFNGTSEEQTIKEYRMMIQQNIRHFCENITDLRYLWTLDGLVSKPINIFTLNYDGIIEYYCEKNNLTYTDGFDPFWNPEKFKDENDVNLFKLHGSLYWIRSDHGKSFSVPLSGLNMSQVRSIGGHPVSEMMLYPKLQKDKQSEVFSWLDRRFKDNLNRVEMCIIIGYSFRDDEIRNSIIESLSANRNLWLIIVNPHAISQKNELSLGKEDLRIKIIAMDVGIEQALNQKDLHQTLQRLPSNRDMEERITHSQKTTKSRLDQEWSHIINNYLEVQHHDRVKWLVESLYGQTFVTCTNNFPNCIEGVVCPYALQYMLEFNKNEQNRIEIWKKIFVESCLSLEYRFFENSNINELINCNPIKSNEVPFYVMSGGTEVFTKLEEMKTKLVVLNMDKFPELKPKLEKLIETLDFLLTKGRHSIINRAPHEIVNGYAGNNLGLKKWAIELVNSLK